MADMGDMDMPVPRNSIPMLSARGPFDPMTLGGMVTIVEVRDELDGERDPGWYAHPPGTVADLARPEDPKRDGIDV